MNIKSSFVILALGALAAQSTMLSHAAEAPVVPPGIYNVKTFGAVGDGVKLDTAAIQRAIDDCSAKGGGTVSFPAGGNYLIGTIYLTPYPPSKP